MSMPIENLLVLPSTNIEQFSSFQYGAHFVQDWKMIDWELAQIAVICISNDKTTAPAHFLSLHEEIGRLSQNANKGTVLFLGYVIGERVGVEEVLAFLASKNIFTLIITNGDTYHSSIIDKETKYLTLIDSHLSYKNKVLNTILKYEPTHLNCIGYQSYYADPQLIQQLQAQYYHTDRLGNIKSDVEDFEPVVRDSQLLYFNLSSIRHSDFPACTFNNPNGFSGEEACRLVRYAAINDICNRIVLSQYDELKDPNAIGTRLIAQMVWYVIGGVLNRKNDYPLRKEQLTLYSIPNAQLSKPLRFYKSKKSDRWWLLLSEYSQLHWVPCAYSDYQRASQGELSQRILDAVERYT